MDDRVSSCEIEALERAAKDLSKVHYIVMSGRPGGSLFCTKLEYEHFPPRTARNKLYDFYILKWPDDAMLWFIVGIPVEEKELAEQVAKECGLVIRNGTPHIFDASPAGVKTSVFPMDGPQVFILESNPKSKIYKNDPDVFESIVRGEKAECDRIIEADNQKMQAELKRRGFTHDQIERLLQKWYGGDENYMETPHGPPQE